MYKLIIFWTLLSAAAIPQIKFDGEIGHFENASAFHINSAGFLFIADSRQDKIYKMDTLGNRLSETGGYGWDASAFDIPADVFSTPLNVYISDKNNHRIQVFDKDLNYISSLSTRNKNDNETSFGYPLSCIVSNQGDMFILDSENKRIIKFDMFGNYLLSFGGYNWGKYSLSEPKKLSTDALNNVFVSDGESIFVYDQFGNGLSILKSTENVDGMNIIFNKFTVNSKNNIYYSDLNLPDFSLKKLNLDVPVNDVIVSSLVFNNKLYVLTPVTIKIYELGVVTE